MKEWLTFLASIADELFDLFVYAQRAARNGQTDPDQEKQIAMKLVRRASDEAMRRELGAG